VRLSFADQPEGLRHWWFVNDGGQAQLCVEDPGYEVDVYLATTLPDMIHVYRGDLSLVRACAEGRIDVHGAAWARRALSRWPSPFPSRG
jgi:hypothetical protein